MNTPNTAPLSWLQLEQYNLGELDDGTRRRIAEQLHDSAEDRACLEHIESDARTLPPLRLPETRAVPAWRSWSWGSLGLAAAAAALLIAVLPGEVPEPLGAGIKGGDLSARLVRERDGIVVDRPTSFTQGDRFKAIVTCPPSTHRTWTVVVFQAEEVDVPIEAAVDCGNDVALPGAFTLSADAAAQICIVADFTSDRAAMATTPADLGAGAICSELVPTPRQP